MPGTPFCQRCGTPAGSAQEAEPGQAHAGGESPPGAENAPGAQPPPGAASPYGGPPPGAPYGGPPPGESPPAGGPPPGAPYGGPPPGESPPAGGPPTTAAGAYGGTAPGASYADQPPGATSPYAGYGGPPPGWTTPHGTGAPATHYSLGGLASALTVLFALNAAADLGALAVPGLGTLLFLLFLALIPVFIVWFYRARKNADGRGWRQRWGPGWAIGAWFVPVISLWFPYQIMADIWRAGLRPEDRRRPAWPPIIWWAGWLLAWVTSFQYVSASNGTYHGTSVSFYLGATVLSKIFEAAAAIAAIVVVRAVSKQGVGLEPGLGQSSAT